MNKNLERLLNEFAEAAGWARKDLDAQLIETATELESILGENYKALPEEQKRYMALGALTFGMQMLTQQLEFVGEAARHMNKRPPVALPPSSAMMPPL